MICLAGKRSKNYEIRIYPPIRDNAMAVARQDDTSLDYTTVAGEDFARYVQRVRKRPSKRWIGRHC